MRKATASSVDAQDNANISSENNVKENLSPKEVFWPQESVVSTFKPWRVFINHIDSYHGKKLAEYLSERVYVDPQNVRNEELGEEEEEELEEQDEEEDEKIEKEKAKLGDEDSKKYEVIGTTSDPEYPQPEDPIVIIRNAQVRDALLKELMNCGIIIYDITKDKGQVEEARWALKAIVQELEKMEQTAPKAFKRNEDVRYFVLISTLMTWAHSKPLSPDEPDLPFTEEDYRKRKAHPNFKEHIQLEKEVVMVKKKVNLKDKLKTVVICCGATYGDEQGPLHYLFKMAWQNAQFLPIFGKGSNKIPLLHVRDLVAVVFDAVQTWPSLRYIVAVEQGPTSQSAIVKKISRALTTGKVKNIPQEEAFLLPEVTQQIYDLMTMNLNIDPEYIADRITWHLGLPFRDSINTIVREYKMARKLHPVKVIVLGPPASGKTRVALYLAKHYDTHYIHAKSLITDTIQRLSSEIEDAASEAEKRAEEGAGDAEDEEDAEEDEEPANVEELQELLDEIERNAERNKGRLDEAVLNKLFLRKLRSKECMNQGYVIDGYPKTLEQARELFGEENLNEPEEAVEEEAEDDVYSSIMPDMVVSLEASDEFLKDRIVRKPEREIQGTHYTEEHVIRRLKEYRNRNTDDNTPLQFFDEIEIHPLIIDVEDDLCPDMFPTIYPCLEILGPPRNYGLTPEEARDARKRAEEEARAAETAVKQQKEREILERKKQREHKMEEWTSLLEKLKEEEQERLCLLGLPLRHYLVEYIFPTLTQGLIEVANLRPDDPIDFLAEYLFKENPEGKMFEPDYTQTMNSVLDVIEQFQDDILPKEELSDKVMEFLKRDREQPDADRTTSTSSEMDVCTSKRTAICVTPSFAYDDIETFGEREEEEEEDEEEAESNRLEDYDKEDV